MLKLYLDENLHPERAAQLRKHDIDVLTVDEAGMKESSDEEQLASAAGHERVLVTADQRVTRLVEHWFIQGRSHCGVVICRQSEPWRLGMLVRLCIRLCSRETPESIANTIHRLEQYR